MNPQPEEDLRRRLDKLEAEINSPPGVVPQPQEPKQIPQSVFANTTRAKTNTSVCFCQLELAIGAI